MFRPPRSFRGGSAVLLLGIGLLALAGYAVLSLIAAVSTEAHAAMLALTRPPLLAAHPDGSGGLPWWAKVLIALFVLGPGQFTLCALIRRLLGREHDILPRVALRLRSLPLRRRRERPFLGFSRGLWITPYHAYGRQQDTVAIVGPPRAGKSSGILIPQLALWAGPAVTTSTKLDVIQATLYRRRQLAERNGGQVHVYAPTQAGPVAGIAPMRWSLLQGCEDPVVCHARVRSLVYAAGSGTGSGTSDATHWREGASAILRGLFAAAAVDPHRPCDLRLVLNWLYAHELDSPAAALSDHGERMESNAWADLREQLLGMRRTESKELSSLFSAARTALSALTNPLILDRSRNAHFDVDAFLASGSTLYIATSSTHQRATGPLISALVETIVTRAYELDQLGQLPHRLLLSLDEVANIAPLESLPSMISQGGGQGVNVCWAAQSLSQLRGRYGRDQAEAIWSASNAKVILGGLGDHQDLAAVAGMAAPDSPAPRDDRPPQPVTARRLREIASRHALLLYGNQPAAWIGIPRWDHAFTLRWAVLGPPAPLARAGAYVIARGRALRAAVAARIPRPAPTPDVAEEEETS